MAKARIWGKGNPEEEAKCVVAIMCPGCKCHHVIATVQPFSNGAKWGFNGDMDKPTFSPSLLITTPEVKDEEYTIPATVCHSWIENGMIRFMDDGTTHHLRGQTVELPDVDHVWPAETAG